MNPSLHAALARLDHALADYAPGEREAVGVVVAELVRELHDARNLAEHFRWLTGEYLAVMKEQAAEIKDMGKMLRVMSRQVGRERASLFRRLYKMVSETRVEKS